MSTTGRHFTPPSPAYRPQDPFAKVTPLSADQVPSCEITSPAWLKEKIEVKQAVGQEITLSSPKKLSRIAQKSVNSSLRENKKSDVVFDAKDQPKSIKQKSKAPSSFLKSGRLVKSIVSNKQSGNRAAEAKTQIKVESVHSPLRKEQILTRKCEWVRCRKSFAVKNVGRSASKRFCSATCRGRASEARQRA